MADSQFTRPDLPQLITMIRSDLLTRLNADIVLRRLDAEVYSRVMAAAVHTVYGYLDYLARNMLPDLADEDWLVRHGNLKQVPRKQPTTAAGFMRWDGVQEGITVPAGTDIQADTQQQYVTTAEATVDADRVLRAPVVAVEAGSAGNCDDGEALRLLTPISGLSSTGYAESVQGGTDLEGLEEWRSRIMARWYYTPQGGADADYKIWATDVAGISRAWVYRHYSGKIGTVGVMPATSNLENPIPDAALVAAVRDYILPLAPVAGSGLYVFAPTAKVIDMEIALAKDTEAIRGDVIREIKSALMRDGVPDGKIYYSRLSEAISLAAGQVAHKLISPATDVELGAYELPVLGTVTFSSYTTVIPDIAVRLESFTPNPIEIGNKSSAVATFEPEFVATDPETVIVWDFVPPDDSGDDPTTLAKITPSADLAGVTVEGLAAGTVHVRITVTYKGKTATDNSYLEIVEDAG